MTVFPRSLADTMLAVTPRHLVLAICGSLAGCATPSSDIPDPSGARRLVRVAELALGAPAVAVVVTGNLAYVGCGDQGIVVVDVSEPRAPEVIGRLEAPRADAIAYSEDRLFALARADGFSVAEELVLTPIDVVDPRAPLALETRPIDGACCIAAAAARAVVGAGKSLLIGAEAKRPLARGVAAEDELLIAVAWRGERIAVVTAKQAGWLGRGRRHAMLELLDPKGASRGEVALGEVNPIQSGQGDLALTADAAYVVVGGRFRQVALPAEGAPIATTDLAIPGARSIALGSDFAAIGGDGLWIVTLGETPELADRITLENAPRDVAVRDDFVIAAVGELGLRVYQVERPEEPSADGVEPE